MGRPQFEILAHQQFLAKVCPSIEKLKMSVAFGKTVIYIFSIYTFKNKITIESRIEKSTDIKVPFKE